MMNNTDTVAVEAPRTSPSQCAIDRAVEELRKQIETVQGLAESGAIADEFLRVFPPEGSAENYNLNPYVNVGFGSGQMHGVLIQWTASRLSDVTSRLKWLADHLGKYTIEDFPELGRRTYNFGDIKFSAFFSGAATVCRFVEVGKKESAVYKLMCGETEVTA